MDCRELKELADSYISDELLIETNHEVLRHLENCAACRGDLKSRRDLRLRIGHAVKNAPASRVDTAFARRLTADTREAALRSPFDRLLGRVGSFGLQFAIAGVAVVMLLAASAYIMFFRGPAKIDRAGTGNSQPQIDGPDARAVKASWSALAEKAAGDHKNCAVEFHLTEKPISLGEASAKYGAFNKDIEAVITEALKTAFSDSEPDRVDVLAAHYCIFEGRPFVHIVLRQKGRLVSIVITDTDVPVDAGEVQTARFYGSLNTAGFRIGRHAVFVVSEMSDAENTLIAKAVEPAIRLQTEKVGT